jgi:RNA polymerase sigma factor (sigma-70 family)
MKLEDLLQSYEGKIQTIARAMARTYRLTREDQEDLCSAMRMRLIAHYEKIDFSRPEAGAYAHYMITNAARTELMTKILKHKDHVYSLDSTADFEDGSEGETYGSMIPDPRSLSEDQISMRVVYEEALAMLPPKHRKMVEMHMAGITNKEIAERVHHKNGKPFAAEYIAYLLSRFRKQLEELVQPTLTKPAAKRPRKKLPSERFTGIRLAIIRHFIGTENKPATHEEITAALSLSPDHVKANIKLLPSAGILELVTGDDGSRRYRLKVGWKERLSKRIRLALEKTDADMLDDAVLEATIA